MHNCLAIDVAKSKSMVTLISSCGEVLIEPYEINHSINDFTNLLNRINKFKLENISVIMESTGIYHRPIERYFLEHNFKVFVINPIYGKMRKRNIRKTKTDKEDCFNLANLFFTNTLIVLQLKSFLPSCFLLINKSFTLFILFTKPLDISEIIIVLFNILSFNLDSVITGSVENINIGIVIINNTIKQKLYVSITPNIPPNILDGIPRTIVIAKSIFFIGNPPSTC